MDDSGSIDDRGFEVKSSMPRSIRWKWWPEEAFSDQMRDGGHRSVRSLLFPKGGTAMKIKLAPGDPAPDFSLPDQTGRIHTLGDYRGRWLLLYFYPKDDTPGCTREACAFRDVYGDIRARGAEVLGVSVDSVKSHEKFAAKYDLPFPLLADEKKTVVRAYGVWGTKKFMGRQYEGTHRVSFLIAPDGTIARVYGSVKPDRHAEEVVADLSRLQG
jgi:peroxiredoxin Q/BCP